MINLFKRFRKHNTKELVEFDQSRFDDFIENLSKMQDLNAERIDIIIEHLKELTSTRNFYVDFAMRACSFDKYLVWYGPERNEYVIPYYLTYFKDINNFRFTPCDCTCNNKISIFYNMSFGPRIDKTCANCKALNDILSRIIPKTIDTLQENLPKMSIDTLYIYQYEL